MILSVTAVIRNFLIYLQNSDCALFHHVRGSMINPTSIKPALVKNDTTVFIIFSARQKWIRYDY